MIYIQIISASECQVLKNVSHYETIWDILSYNTVFKKFGKLTFTKGSAFHKGTGRFGLGLLDIVTNELDKKEVEYDIKWSVKPVKKLIKKDISLSDKTLEGYQKNVLSKLQNGVMRGIVHASTGSGKTTIATSVVKLLNYPNTLIIVPSKTIGYGFKKTLETSLKIPVGFIGDSVFDRKRITVALYQSLKEKLLKTGEFNNVELIIQDEAHLAITKISSIIQTYFNHVWYRFGLTATPVNKETDPANFYKMVSQIGEPFIQITDKQAEKRVINKVEAYVFKFKGRITKYDYKSQYRFDILLNRERCKHLCKMVNFAFEKKKVKNVLLLVDEYQQALKIVSCARSMKMDITPTLAWRETNNTEIINNINNGKIKWCIATPVFSVGTDIPEIECVCLGSARKSLSNTIQKIGRGRRKTDTKDKMILLDVYDEYNDKFFDTYSKTRLDFYKSKEWKVTVINDWEDIDV